VEWALVLMGYSYYHHYYCPLTNMMPSYPSSLLLLPPPSPPLRVGKFTLRQETEEVLPVGFDLSHCHLTVNDLSNFRIRRDDNKKLVGDEYYIGGVYFPLLASIIPKWRKVIVEKYRETMVRREEGDGGGGGGEG